MFNQFKACDCILVSGLKVFDGLLMIKSADFIVAVIYTCSTKPFTPIYVTGFGKTCIVHTSNFAHLDNHKNHREWYTDLKLS